MTYVEIDRCATDAIVMVTGCGLGKRTLKFRDWGKMAATFVDFDEGRAIRIVALDGSRELAHQLYPHLESGKPQQMQGYSEMAADQLFCEEWVKMAVGPADKPRYKTPLITCVRFKESVNFGRVCEVDGQQLCLSCVRPELRYWEPNAR